jgi:YD repeat-containing protein
MQSVFYDASGEVVGKVTEDPRNTRLTYVVPGLLSESTLNFACKPRPPAAKKKS